MTDAPDPVAVDAIPAPVRVGSQPAAGDGVVAQVVHTLGTRAGLVVSGALVSILVARALGPEGRGTYVIAVTIGAVGVQLGNLGLQAANTYFAARDRTLLPALVGNSLVVGLGAGTAAALAVGAVFTTWPSIAPVRGVLLFVALVWVPLGLAALFLQNVLIGVDRIRDTNRIEIVTRAAGLACLVGVIVAGLVDVIPVLLAGLFALVLSLAWLWVRVRSILSAPPRPSRDVFAQTLRYGTKAYAAALFAFLVIRSDLFVVQYLRGAGETGQYSVAVALADLVYMLPAVVATVVFPKLTAATGSADRFRLALRSTGAVTALLAAGTVVAFFAADPAIRLLYGAAFEPAVQPFLWLLPGMLFLGAETVLVQYLNSEGFPLFVVAGWAGALVVNVSLNLVLVPKWGATGSAIASSVCYGGMLVLVGAGSLVHHRRAVHAG